MILDQKRNDITIDGDIEQQVDMHISHNMEEHIMRMLIKAYSDPIGSLIREAASNAVDSHRMAQVNEPIICRLKRDIGGSWYFEVEDFGLGLDEQEFHKYIMGIGESNKRGLAGVIGGYGIGAKAASSYTQIYYYTCRKDGIERKFMIYQGERKITSEKIYEIETTERNGVIVNIPVQTSDIYRFKDKIMEQLCYFSGVYFDSELPIKNDFKIYRDEHFQWSELCTNRNMHISMDDVYYPINWASLGMQPIEVPIALRFSLTDGLLPIPNRENLEYTKDTIAIIKEKIQTVAEILVTRYNDTIKETDDYKKVFDYYSTSYRPYTIEGTDKIIQITNISNYSTVKVQAPTLSGFTYLNLKRLYEIRGYIFNDYELKYCISYGTFTSKVKYESFDLSDILNKKVYVINERPKKKIIDYIKSLDRNCYFVQHTNTFYLGKLHSDRWKSNYRDYIYLLNLRGEKKENWRKIIEEFQMFRKKFLPFMTNLEDVQIPEVYKEEKEKQIKERKERRILEQGEISLAVSQPLERSVKGKNCKFVKEVFTYKSIKQIGGLVVYGKEADAEGLDSLWQVSKRITKVVKKKLHKRIIPVMVTDREYTKLQKAQINSTITYEEFMKGKTKPFKVLVTALMLDKWMDKQSFAFDNMVTIKELSTALYDDLLAIQKYCEDISEYSSPGLEKSILEYAEANRLWDETIMVSYRRAMKLIPNFQFLEYLTKKRYGSNELSPEAIAFAKEYLKLKKVRLNLECYKQTTLFQQID